MLLFSDQLLCQELGKMILQSVQHPLINYEQVIETKAIRLLEEIGGVLKNDALDDFEMVEKIVCLFEKNGLSTDGCHDFG